MLPVHRSPPPPSRWSKRSLLPRSRLSFTFALLFGAFVLYSFYSFVLGEPQWVPTPGHPHFSPFTDSLPPPRPIHNAGKPLKNVPSGPKNKENVNEVQLVWKARANDVKLSFIHAWESYEKVAWGADELQPLSGKPIQNFNGWGVSIVDALDTLLIMDLRPQFARAMEHVASMNFSQKPHEIAPFFETTIRYLGGLLGAYALVVDRGATSGITWEPTPFAYDALHSKQGQNKDPVGTWTAAHADLDRTRIANILLTRADHLARALLPVFNTTSSLPVWGVNTLTGTQRDNWVSLLAEIGSCQMEYKYLAHITGRREYFDAANRVTDVMELLQQKELLDPSSKFGGMFPTRFMISTGQPADQFISVGSLADSAYEYLLKGYLMSGRTEHRLLGMYLASAHTALRNLTYLSPERDLLYITDAHGGVPSHRFEHLSCFFPGLLSLGVDVLNSKMSSDGRPVKVELPEDIKERHFWAAEGIAETCWLLYADNPMGLGSEEVNFDRPMIPSSPTSNVPLGDDVGGPKPDASPLVVPDVSHNRWWDIVDDWVRSGRHGEKPRGYQGPQREVVVTNGGKGSWESGNGLPAGNERPIATPTEGPSTAAGGYTKPMFGGIPNNVQRTHLRDYSVKDDRWLMRPETIEALYMMYRLTRESIWRDRCYGIYKGMEKFSRTTMGYASVRGIAYDIDAKTRLVKGADQGSYAREFNLHEDSMPSYGLAETFKYLYLCLLDPDESAALLPSDKWIFNTEAHPFPVFNWTELELTEWNIH